MIGKVKCYKKGEKTREVWPVDYKQYLAPNGWSLEVTEEAEPIATPEVVPFEGEASTSLMTEDGEDEVETESESVEVVEPKAEEATDRKSRIRRAKKGK